MLISLRTVTFSESSSRLRGKLACNILRKCPSTQKNFFCEIQTYHIKKEKRLYKEKERKRPNKLRMSRYRF